MVENESDRTALECKWNRNKFIFVQIEIKVGETLEFKKNPSITAKVLKNDQIEFWG